MSNDLKYFIAYAILTLVAVMFAKQFQNLGDKIISQRRRILYFIVGIIVISLQFGMPIYKLHYNFHHLPFDRQFVYSTAFHFSAIVFAFFADYFLYLLFRIINSTHEIREKLNQFIEFANHQRAVEKEVKDLKEGTHEIREKLNQFIEFLNYQRAVQKDLKDLKEGLKKGTDKPQ